MPKRCSKGKACGSSCVNAQKKCQIEVSQSVKTGLTKVVSQISKSPTKKVDESWFSKGSFTASKKPAKEPFEIAKKDGVLQTLEGPVSYKKGFYLMTGPKGERYPVPPDTFKKLKVDNGDGTASPIPIPKKVKVADHSGVVKTSWGEDLNYVPGDFIVRHGANDYGVIRPDIFKETYQTI